MTPTRKIGVATGASLFLGAVMVYVFRHPATTDGPDVPKGAIYYSGPMKQKGKSVFASEDGRIVTEAEANQTATVYQRQQEKNH